MSPIEKMAREHKMSVEELLDLMVVSHKTAQRISRVLGVNATSVSWRLHQNGYEFVDGAWKKTAEAKP